MSWSNIIQLGIKELRELSRDTALMLLIVVAFTLQVYSGSRALPETLNNAAIAIVDEDQSPLSGRISTAFYPPYFVPPKQITTTEMDKRMDAGLDTFAINIPPDFQRDLLAGQEPTIQLNVDATRMTQAFTGSGNIQSIITSEVSEFLDRYRSDADVPVDLALRARFNPSLSKSWFGSINNIITAITMLSIVLTGAALIREREHGTLEHLLVMPVTPTEILISKIWSMGLVVLMATTFSLFVVVEGMLDIPINGSPLIFLAGTVIFLLATTSMGIFLATIAGSMPQFGMLLILVLLPLLVLSGAMTPRESMPEIIQAIMYFAPNTHFVILSQAVLFRGAPFSVVWPQFLTLAAIAAALFLFALRQFRRFLQ